MEVPDNLAGEPLVQLLVCVEHQALLLGSLLTLSHQGSILISLKQARNLQRTGNINILGTRKLNAHNSNRYLLSQKTKGNVVILFPNELY